jgi:hypothetical protein
MARLAHAMKDRRLHPCNRRMSRRRRQAVYLVVVVGPVATAFTQTHNTATWTIHNMDLPASSVASTPRSNEWNCHAARSARSSPPLRDQRTSRNQVVSDQIPNTVEAFCRSKGLCSCHVLNNLVFDNMALRMHFSLFSLLTSTKIESVSL